MPSMPFRGSSVLWVVTDTGSTSLLSIVTTLVMARFAGPSDFGAASLIMGMTMLVNLYVEGLFHDALIQSQSTDDAVYDQALTLVLLIAALMVGIAGVGACLLAGGAYARYGWLSLGSCTLLLFSGPIGVATARLRRDLRFREVARASVIGRAIGCLAAVALALAGFTLAGLIGQNTVAAMVDAAILYAGGAWRPRLRRSFAALGPILRFALPYAAMHTIVAARIQGFAFLVASLMGLSAAGYVNVAFRLTTTPQLVLATTLTNLCFPLLARDQASRPAFRRAFALTNRLITTIAFPLFVGLALVAHDLLPPLLGPGWGPSVPLVQLMAFGAALGFSRTAGSLALRALGYIRFSFWNAIFQLAVTLGGLALLRPSDPLGAIGLWLTPIVVQAPVTWFVIRSTAGIGLVEQARELAPSLAAVLAMAFAVLTAQGLAESLPDLLRLTLSVAVGAAAFVATILISDGEIRAVVRRRGRLAT